MSAQNPLANRKAALVDTAATLQRTIRAMLAFAWMMIATAPLLPGEAVEHVDKVTVSVLAAPKPKAIAILLPGGDGVLELGEKGFAREETNFLVRARQRFVDAGFVAIVVDRKDGPRASDGENLHAVAKWAHEKFALPIFFVGTSRGTISALSAPEGKHVHGVVLTSTVTVEKKGKETVYDDKAPDVPVLMIHADDDACPASPVDGARVFARKVKAKLIEMHVGKGDGDRCGGESPHGFMGSEQKVVDAIAAWCAAQ
jgi:hypothetical protein